MARLKKNGNEIEVPDGVGIKEYAEQLGIIFGCRQGRCGTCMCRIAEGMENLETQNQAELDFGLPAGYRLCCQAKIKSGDVELKQE